MIWPLSRQFERCDRNDDDCRARHEYRRQRDVLAGQTRALSRSLDAGKYELAISHPVLSEYEEVVARLAARYPTKPPTNWLIAIRQAGHLCLPLPLTPVTADPDDEMFIECAVAARADYLVTGDKGHLLSLKQAGGVPIVSASKFLLLLGLPENPA